MRLSRNNTIGISLEQSREFDIHGLFPVINHFRMED